MDTNTTQNDRIAQLQAEVEQKRAELKKEKLALKTQADKVETEARQKLLSLHTTVGYASTDDLVKALKRAQRKSRPAKKRVTITDEMRKNIVTAIKAEDKTSKQIANEFNVSEASVNNIKSKENLTNPRKSKSTATA